MIEHVFLSPHFDDAVGSCGGTIGHLARVGRAVRVLTLFGGIEREPFSVPAEVLHSEWGLERPVRQRRLEDARACLALGCESSFCEFPDAIYRQNTDGQHLYPTFESLRGSIAPEDSGLAETLATKVRSYLSKKNTVVYCPLAIGAHVDHLAVRECGELLEKEGFTVAFYRDFYYDQKWSGEAGDSTITRLTVKLTGDQISKKLSAFSEYKSQISDLFSTHNSMTSYFTEIGKNELFFLSKRADSFLLEMLRDALMQEALP